MHPFTFERAETVEAAAAAVAGDKSAKYLAGGTTLVDLMKLHVERPGRLVDVNRTPLDRVDVAADGGGAVRVGAMVRNTALAYHKAVQERYAVLSQAILAGASPQIRNMATAGGNLLQRVRCPYFRDGISPCNKRQPGSGCAMAGGFDRTAAVLGTTEQCIATHPSDMAVALLALDAVVHTHRPAPAAGRQIPIDQFYVLPRQAEVETALEHGELITAVELPALEPGSRQAYVKLRDRASYEFALASVAAVVWMADDGTIARAQVALGGVGTRPWRDRGIEQSFAGKRPAPELFRAAADAMLLDAKPGKYNAFKVELAKRAIQKCLTDLTANA